MIGKGFSIYWKQELDIRVPTCGKVFLDDRFSQSQLLYGAAGSKTSAHSAFVSSTEDWQFQFNSTSCMSLQPRAYWEYTDSLKDNSGHEVQHTEALGDIRIDIHRIKFIKAAQPESSTGPAAALPSGRPGDKQTSLHYASYVLTAFLHLNSD